MDEEPLLPLWISKHWLVVLELLQSLFQRGFESWIDIVVGKVKDGIAPILGGPQTWRLSQWRFIRSDENSRKEIFYLSREIIPER